MERIYLDTHIYADYWEGREDKLRPLGEFAYRLLKEALECKFLILISKLTLHELKNGCGVDDLSERILISDLFFAQKIKFVHANEKQLSEAKKLSQKLGIPKGDAMHSILARDNNATLVSRDKHHDLVSDVVKVVTPEEII